MVKKSGVEQTDQQVPPKVNVKRKYAPPRVTRLKPYKVTHGGGTKKSEDHPVFAGISI